MGVGGEGGDEREEELSHDDDDEDGLGGSAVGTGGVNEEGVNVEVGEEGLKRYLAGEEGAVFVKYYAPW